MGFTLPHLDLSLKDKANVSAADNYGSTPLHFAAYRGCKEIVELLLAKSMDVDTPSTSFDNTNTEQFQAVSQSYY